MSKMELNKNKFLLPSKIHSCSLLALNPTAPKDTYNVMDNKCPELTVGMFFEFMRITYQVNNSFEGLAAMLTTKSEINWNKLAKIDLNMGMTVGNKKPEYDNQSSRDLINDNESLNDEKLNLTKESLMPQSSSMLQNTVDSDCRMILPFTTSQYIKKITSLQNAHLNSIEKKDDLPNLETKENNVKDTDRLLGNVLHVEQSKTKQRKQHVPEKERVLMKIMRKNLSDVLYEGLLDSILPYMIPKAVMSQPVIKKSIAHVDMKKTTSLPHSIDNGMTTSLSVSKERDKSKQVKKSTDMNEVEIHVCDEGKNMKKDFRCPQKLLIQKMRYFADITAGQKLEEIDISVHCDIVIFDWLMRWVKKDIIKKSEWPTLETNNVIPIMVSASFLQMEPLLYHCLQYCHNNMSDILKTPTTLTCLNDNLLSRLAALFTNEDVESLQDKKDKIQSRLFCKLIISLTEINPDNKRGHYSSLATLFKCGKCNKNVVQSISDFIPCISTAMQIDNKGIIHNKHIRDPTWSLNKYITNLRSESRSWRDIYWRLWSDCHFLFCQCCKTYFSIHQMDWCCYHPECSQFFVNEQQRPMPFPLGRYPCCSQRAYRFEVLPNQRGCKYKEHVPNIKTEKDINILNIFVTNKEIMSIEPPQLFFPEKITRLVACNSTIQLGKLMCKETMWWNGLELVPSRLQLGLLGKIWSGSTSHKFTPTLDLEKPLNKDLRQIMNRSPASSSATYSDEDEMETNQGDNDIDDELYDSEESSAWGSLRSIDKTKRQLNIPTMKSGSGRCWSTNLIVRYNQDNQRDFEERTSAQMISFLTKRTSIEQTVSTKSCNRQRIQIYKNILPVGGTYMKLEAEFRDQWAQSFKYKNPSRGKNSIRSKKQ